MISFSLFFKNLLCASHTHWMQTHANTHAHTRSMELISYHRYDANKHTEIEQLDLMKKLNIQAALSTHTHTHTYTHTHKYLQVYMYACTRTGAYNYSFRKHSVTMQPTLSQHPTLSSLLTAVASVPLQRSTASGYQPRETGTCRRSHLAGGQPPNRPTVNGCLTVASEVKYWPLIVAWVVVFEGKRSM